MDTITDHPSLPSTSREHTFPIVGIGASSGGLEALTQMLTHLSPSTGMSYVLIQHMDSNHASLLAHRLTQVASLAVQEARDGLPVRANHIYVSPPNTDLTLEGSTLKFMPSIKTEGQHLSIDTFFKSLAENEVHFPIGVILSGSGVDGARGLQRIKERGGITLAQEAHSARASSMPQSAIASGCVDIIEKPEQLAHELLNISQHPSMFQHPLQELRPHIERTTPREQATWAILRLVRQRTTIDFLAYKPLTLMRRIARRMVLHHLENEEEYMALQTIYGFKMANLLSMYEPWYQQVVDQLMRLPEFAWYWQQVHLEKQVDAAPTSVAGVTLDTAVPRLGDPSRTLSLRPLVISIGYFHYTFPQIIGFLPNSASDQAIFEEIGLPSLTPLPGGQVVL